MRYLIILNLFSCLLFCNISCNYTIISTELRKIFKKHEKCEYLIIILIHFLDLEYPLEDNELLCNCNTPGCDGEIIEITNSTYSGICRAYKNGLCRTFKNFDKQGKLLNFLQQYVLLIFFIVF